MGGARNGLPAPGKRQQVLDAGGWPVWHCAAALMDGLRGLERRTAQQASRRHPLPPGCRACRAAGPLHLSQCQPLHTRRPRPMSPPRSFWPQHGEHGRGAPRRCPRLAPRGARLVPQRDDTRLCATCLSSIDEARRGVVFDAARRVPRQPLAALVRFSRSSARATVHPSQHPGGILHRAWAGLA